MKKALIAIGVIILVGLAGVSYYLYDVGVFSSDAVYSTSAGAIDGYDAVAYFTEGRAVKGSSEFQSSWQGANWHFSSAEHQKAFLADPDKYAPQYGGYCAYGMAGGYKAKTEGEAWHIKNGKLYLNYNQEVQATWRADADALIEQADINWPDVHPTANP